MCYANTLRERMTENLSKQELSTLICATGHTANMCGHLLAVVGGWRVKCTSMHLHVYVVDVNGGGLHEPSLAPGSARPMRRLRHSSCTVQTPRWANLPAGAPTLPSLLVLGGSFDGGHPSHPELNEATGMLTHSLERGDPVPAGLMVLTLLSFCDSSGELVKWTEAEAVGSAPAAIWHHASASFASGAKAVVFGGDFPENDTEFREARTAQPPKPPVADVVCARTRASAALL